MCGGLIAGIFTLKEFVAGACPGLLSALIFIAPDGDMGNFWLACVVAVVSIAVSFVATRVIIAKFSEGGLRRGWSLKGRRACAPAGEGQSSLSGGRTL